MSDNLAPIIFSLTHTLLWHRRQLFLLPQSVSERVKRPNLCLFRLEFHYFGGPGSGLLLLAVADVGIHFPENIVNLFTRAWPLDRIWGRVPEIPLMKEKNFHRFMMMWCKSWILPYNAKVSFCNLF